MNRAFPASTGRPDERATADYPRLRVPVPVPVPVPRPEDYEIIAENPYKPEG